MVTTRNTSRAFLRSAGRALGCCGFVLHRLKAPCMPLIVRIPLLGGARFYLRNDTGRAESIAKYYFFFKTHFNQLYLINHREDLFLNSFLLATQFKLICRTESIACAL